MSSGTRLAGQEWSCAPKNGIIIILNLSLHNVLSFLFGGELNLKKKWNKSNRSIQLKNSNTETGNNFWWGWTTVDLLLITSFVIANNISSFTNSGTIIRRPTPLSFSHSISVLCLRHSQTHFSFYFRWRSSLTWARPFWWATTSVTFWRRDVGSSSTTVKLPSRRTPRKA